jgi:hypothetical protein
MHFSKNPKKKTRKKLFFLLKMDTTFNAVSTIRCSFLVSKASPSVLELIIFKTTPYSTKAKKTNTIQANTQFSIAVNELAEKLKLNCFFSSSPTKFRGSGGGSCATNARYHRARCLLLQAYMATGVGRVLVPPP